MTAPRWASWSALIKVRTGVCLCKCQSGGAGDRVAGMMARRGTRAGERWLPPPPRRKGRGTCAFAARFRIICVAPSHMEGATKRRRSYCAPCCLVGTARHTHTLPYTILTPGSIKLSVVSSSTGSVVSEEEEFAGVAAPSSTALDGGPADVRLAGAVLGAFRKKDRTTGYRYAAGGTGTGRLYDTNHVLWCYPVKLAPLRLAAHAAR